MQIRVILVKCGLNPTLQWSFGQKEQEIETGNKMDDLFLVGFSAALYNPFNSNDPNMPLPMKALSFYIEKLVFKAHNYSIYKY